jgi:hypothetical protein
MKTNARTRVSASGRHPGCADLANVVFVLGILSASAAWAGERVPLIEEAFRQYSLKAGLLVQGEVMVAETSCPTDGGNCEFLSLSSAPRDSVVKQLAQLASGFGYGVVVEEMRVKASAENYLEASVSVVVRTDRKEAGIEGLSKRADELTSFLRMLARMSEAYREEFNPLKVAPERKLYFIDEFAMLEGGTRMSARLLGPSAAPEPKRQGKAASGESFRISVKLEGSETRGSFAGWKAYRVVWERMQVPDRRRP